MSEKSLSRLYYNLLTMPIEASQVVASIRRFYKANEGDEPTTNLLAVIGADILDCSTERFLELMNSNELEEIMEEA